MQNYAPSKSVTVTVQLLTESGDAIEPTSLRWRVLDESDLELVTWTPVTITDPTISSLSVAVLAANNTLAAGVLRGIRTVEFEASNNNGTYLLRESYLLQGATALAFGVNTFLTHSQAMLLAHEFAHEYLSAWVRQSREDQEAALQQAHMRIIKLPLVVDWGVENNVIVSAPWGRLRFEDMQPAQVAQLDARQQKALKRAQLIEACYILTEEGIDANRSDKLSGKTTGESSEYFRQVKPLDLGVCKEAYRELARWVDRAHRIGRA